ncbi:glycosyltransferase family 4 protein [Niabella sp. 22666]|uniref:glycosyltransferase family 4 protein n=1 Tax=Niabella sp. 22666 TaxID=3453954 RepID=UPI003F82827E
MTIAIISNTASALLNFRKELILYLQERDIVVYALATDFDKKSKENLKLLGAIPVDYQLSRGGLNPLSDLANVFSLVRIIKKINPDVVLSTFAKPVIFGTIAAWGAGVKRIVAMLEGLGYFFTDQPEGITSKTRIIKGIQVLLYRLSLPLADKVIFLNNDDHRDLLQTHKIKVKSCEILGPIGLSLKEFSYIQPKIDPVSFIFVGRLLKEKGIHDYLKAAEIIKKQYSEVVFYVIGGLDNENPGSLSGDELNYYITNNIIQYPGHVKDVATWIANSSVFVLPSYREGFPRSTQEAMALGRAIITTDVPGCRATVVDGKNGFLIPKWNVNKLVEAMSYFIENSDSIVKMGLESFRIASEEYDSNLINEKLRKLILPN